MTRVEIELDDDQAAEAALAIEWLVATSGNEHAAAVLGPVLDAFRGSVSIDRIRAVGDRWGAAT